MTQTKTIVRLARDVMATLIPSGAAVRLPKDTEVIITQALGDSFTVQVFGNLVRIEGKDAVALGRDNQNPLEALPADATMPDKVWALLRTIYDPEIPVNIVDLGLVYDCHIEKLDTDDYSVHVQMTLTAPGCGMGPILASEAKSKLLSIPTIRQAEVKIVFDPPWDRSMLSEAAKLELGLM